MLSCQSRRKGARRLRGLPETIYLGGDNKPGVASEPLVQFSGLPTFARPGIQFQRASYSSYGRIGDLIGSRSLIAVNMCSFVVRGLLGIGFCVATQKNGVRAHRSINARFAG